MHVHALSEYGGHAGLQKILLNKIPDTIRNHFVAMSGEFVGTVLFLWFALSGTQVANSIPSSSGLSVEQTGSNPQQLQYIALCFGFSLAVNAWVFFRISGGLFNPAVTLGMCLIGIYLGALVQCMFPGGLNVQTSLGGGSTVVQGLFIEMFLTAQLVFTIFMLAAEKHKGTFIAPVGIGLSMFIAELTGVYYTGGSLNPARSFGPDVVNTSFTSYHWIYWLGPMLGAALAAAFFNFIKFLEYETANPGQDLDHVVDEEPDVASNELQSTSRSSNEKALPGFDPKVGNRDPDRRILSNGQGCLDQGIDGQPMYGTAFRGTSTSSASDQATIRKQMSESRLAKHDSHVNRIGQHPSVANGSVSPGSPVIAARGGIAAGNGHDDTLGAMVPEPRKRFARTVSSGV
ncbi:hypothetical protein Q7P37_010420 [Cladosporium fusiforme]